MFEVIFMHIKYETEGVCAKVIEYDYDNGLVHNIWFDGGCPGHLQMLSKLLDGWEADKIVAVCTGNLCRNRGTSCADQLAKSLIKIEEEEKALV